MLSCRVILDVPFQLAVFVSGLLAEHRRELGTRDGTRALTCWKQAVFALAWFRDRPDIRRLGQGLGISQATAYRYKDEAIEVLAAKAPTLREALDKAVEQGLPYLILDGTLISSDRCADKKTSKKGKETGKWYSGNAHEPAGNVQALAAPGGVPLWVSDVLPDSTHDLTAARELVLPQARPYLKDLPFLADSGYEGAGAGVHVPVKKPRHGELDPDTKTRNALLRSLRYQGERGFALMSQRWRAVQHVMISPSAIGGIAKSVLVLVQFEHKMISWKAGGTSLRQAAGSGWWRQGWPASSWPGLRPRQGLPVTMSTMANAFVTIVFVPVRSGAPVSRRNRPAKPPLTREGIIAVTLRLLRAEGLERVTMRRLARELDTGPASLYVYIDNMADLHGAVLDRLLFEVDLRPASPAGPWRDRLVELLVAYTELLFAHPSLARSVLTLRPRPSGPNYMRLVDSVLVLLRMGGVPAGQAAWGVSLLLQLAVATAAEHGTRRESAGVLEQDELSWREVSAAEHPGIAWASGELFSGGHHRMRWAFDVLIAGIAASELPPRPSPPAPGGPRER